MIPHGVTASIAGSSAGHRFDGAAVLRLRPHPRTETPVLQIGVPDEVLGFRPEPGVSYRIAIVDGAERQQYSSHEVWLERVQSSWWFVLDPSDERAAERRFAPTRTRC